MRFKKVLQSPEFFPSFTLGCILVFLHIMFQAWRLARRWAKRTMSVAWGNTDFSNSTRLYSQCGRKIYPGLISCQNRQWTVAKYSVAVGEGGRWATQGPDSCLNLHEPEWGFLRGRAIATSHLLKFPWTKRNLFFLQSSYSMCMRCF